MTLVWYKCVSEISGIGWEGTCALSLIIYKHILNIYDLFLFSHYKF